MGTMKVIEPHIRQSISLALRAREHGNNPFGALLAIDDKIIASAENTVNSDRNPTSHAEMNLVQLAVKQLTTAEIAEATLYTSCEPCAMCAGAIYWIGVRRLVYALSSDELARLTGGNLVVHCREVFDRARDKVEVAGPYLTDEALKVHDGYWV
jgi:tRNA(Arg) A34 adenosine deaminase TadA